MRFGSLAWREEKRIRPIVSRGHTESQKIDRERRRQRQRPRKRVRRRKREGERKNKGRGERKERKKTAKEERAKKIRSGERSRRSTATHRGDEADLLHGHNGSVRIEKALNSLERPLGFCRYRKKALE